MRFLSYQHARRNLTQAYAPRCQQLACSATIAQRTASCAGRDTARITAPTTMFALERAQVPDRRWNSLIDAPRAARLLACLARRVRVCARYLSPQVTLRKRGTRSGFQIPLESHRALLVGEIDDDRHFPGSARDGVRATSRVVRRESGRNVRRQACVVASQVSFALQDVDR